MRCIFPGCLVLRPHGRPFERKKNIIELFISLIFINEECTLSFCNKGSAAEVDKVLAAVRDEIASFENLRLGTRDRHRRNT